MVLPFLLLRLHCDRLVFGFLVNGSSSYFLDRLGVFDRAALARTGFGRTTFSRAAIQFILSAHWDFLCRHAGSHRPGYLCLGGGGGTFGWTYASCLGLQLLIIGHLLFGRGNLAHEFLILPISGLIVCPRLNY